MSAATSSLGSGADAPRGSGPSPDRGIWTILVLLSLLQIGLLWPVVAGHRTFFLRDVLQTHLPFYASAARLEAESVPLDVDLLRDGQPLLGNPNAMLRYPDRDRFGYLDPLRALNLHLVLHFLLAPWAMSRLGRAWGLGSAGAVAAGVVYGTGGMALSILAFANLAPGFGLAPMLVASALGSAKGSRRDTLWFGLSWTLLLLAGAPTFAVLALLASGAAILLRGEARRRGLARTSLATLLGLLLALPVVVDLLRLVPSSFRGVHGYGAAGSLAASWTPLSVLEWFVPLAFGRPDRLGPGGLGTGFEAAVGSPFFLSLAPGLLALAAMVAVRWSRRSAWAWSMIGIGVAVALGSHDPAVDWLVRRFGAGLVRFPVKAWLLVALGSSLLAGAGIEALFFSQRLGQRRRFLGALAGLALILGLVVWLGPGWLAEPAARAEIAARWARIGAVGLATLAAASLLVRRRGWEGLAMLLSLHVGSQLVLLHPVAPTVALAALDGGRELELALPARDGLVQGDLYGLFGSRSRAAAGRDTRELVRRGAGALHPFVGIRRGLGYHLVPSPEGLDTALSALAAEGLRRSGDLERVRLLEAWGSRTLILGRDLEPEAGTEVDLVATIDGERLYELAPEPWVRLVECVERAPHPAAAVALLGAPGFDRGGCVVLPGPGGREGTPGSGQVELVDVDGPRLRLEVATTTGGVVVVDRAWLPLYDATVDGKAVPVEAANLYRLGVRVPPGRHRVEIDLEPRPPGEGAARLLGLFGLLGLALGPGRFRLRGRRW